MVAYSKYKVIFSYTLECGYHRSTHLDSTLNRDYSHHTYQQLGRNILHSISLFIHNSQAPQIHVPTLRQQLASDIAKKERFRRQLVKTKIKNIQALYAEQIYSLFKNIFINQPHKNIYKNNFNNNNNYNNNK